MQATVTSLLAAHFVAGEMQICDTKGIAGILSNVGVVIHVTEMPKAFEVTYLIIHLKLGNAQR